MPDCWPCARVELQEGRAAEALIWLNRTLDADPYNWEANDQRGLALRRLGRTEEAEAAVARAGNCAIPMPSSCG